ncbi:MAG TPA: HAMP domain-containing sensor histidine kinase [Herpetosiphonaceae bacterium]
MIVQTIQEALVVLDGAGRIRFANAAFYQAFAAAPPAEGQRLLDLGGGAWDTPALRQLLRGLAADQVRVDGHEIRQELPGAGLKVMLLNGRRLEGMEDGWVLLTITDVTALDELGRERDALLEREQAARVAAEAAYREARAAIAARETFLAVAAHELKTPLTTMLGRIQLIQRRAAKQAAVDPLEQRSYAAIQQQGQRLNLMIDQLFDMSRIESGQLVLDRRPMSLAALIGQLADDLAPRLAEGGHWLDLQLDDVDDVIAADESRMRQAIENVIGNAMKYSPPGSPITVRLARDGRLVCLHVLDEGIGIDAAEIPLLFTPFYRSPSSATRAQSGLGVGLYVVKEIVERHDGSLSVESVAGEGSTFTFCLPALHP